MSTCLECTFYHSVDIFFSRSLFIIEKSSRNHLSMAFLKNRSNYCFKVLHKRVQGTRTKIKIAPEVISTCDFHGDRLRESRSGLAENHEPKTHQWKQVGIAIRDISKGDIIAWVHTWRTSMTNWSRLNRNARHTLI